jgi:hypothetical protein
MDIVKYDPANIEVSITKSTKGSFALAIAFANREARSILAARLYAHWLATGQYRPVARDLLAALPASVRAVAEAMFPQTGPIPKATLQSLATLANAAFAKRKKLTGRAAFLAELAQRIAGEGNAEAVAQQ